MQKVDVKIQYLINTFFFFAIIVSLNDLNNWNQDSKSKCLVTGLVCGKDQQWAGLGYEGMTSSHIKEETTEDKSKEGKKKYIQNLNLSVAVLMQTACSRCRLLWCPAVALQLPVNPASEEMLLQGRQLIKINDRCWGEDLTNWGEGRQH